jgi:hypothetical protein
MDAAHHGGPLAALAALPGLADVAAQLDTALAVTRAEQARQAAGAAITRRAWKNLVFTGGPGTGKSRAAAAVAATYRDLGVLPSGHLAETDAADLAAPDIQHTAELVRTAASRGRGGILMITGASLWAPMHDQHQQALRCLLEVLATFRDDLAVILAGPPGPLHDLLTASPSLASRFPAIIDFPGYTPAELTAIFTTLATAAGFTVTPDATQRAAALLGQAVARTADPGSARLAVRLLDQATACQAARRRGMHPARRRHPRPRPGPCRRPSRRPVPLTRTCRFRWNHSEIVSIWIAVRSPRRTGNVRAALCKSPDHGTTYRRCRAQVALSPRELTAGSCHW